MKLMRNLLTILALFASAGAPAQTPTLTPPTVATPMPAPILTVTVGSSITISANPVTEDTTGAALTGPVTYNLWGVETGTAVEENDGLTSPTVIHTGMTAGLKCYVYTASVVGDIDSMGSTPPVCVDVVAAPPVTPQVATPTGVTVILTPPPTASALTDKSCIAADQGCAPAVMP